MEIFKLLKANIKHKKGAFKSIAALMAIIVFSFTGTISNNDNIDRTVEEAQIWSDTPDMTAFVPTEYADDELFSAINDNADVTDVKTEHCISSVKTVLNEQEAYQTAFVYPESHNVYRVFNDSFTGYIENPAPLENGEIYIAYALKGLYKDIEEGTEVSLDFLSADSSELDDMNTYKFKVKGFIADPDFGASAIGTKRFFVSDTDFEKMYGETRDENIIVEAAINLCNGADYIQVKKDLDDSCGLAEKSKFVISSEEQKGYTKIYSDTGSGVVIAFVILLIAIAIISMYHSISTSIEMEYINLGILKSQGFTSGKIRLVYILQYLIAEIIGTVSGLIISVPILYLLGTLFQSITGLATIHRISFLKCGLLSVAIIAVSIIFVVLATRKISKISPVRAISGGKSETHFDSRFNIPIKAKPLSFFLGFRQFTSRGKSYTGIILITALLVYFMMSIMVLSDRLSGGEIIEGSVFPNISITTSEEFQITDMENFEDTVCGIDENAEIIFFSNAYMMADGIEFWCIACSPAELMYQPLDGRLPVYDNEIAITEIVSEKLDKKIGDTIMLGSGKNAKEFIVTGYYQSLSELGKTFIITAEGKHRVTGELPNCYIELSDLSLIDSVSEALQEQHGALIGAMVIDKERDTSADGMIALIDAVCIILVIVIFAISIIFSAVVISMICSKAFIKERTDIGILKSLGFTANTLRIQFALRFVITAVIGSLIGGTASIFLTSPLLEALMKILGLTQIEAKFTIFTFLLPALAVCINFYIFAYFTARKINTVEVRELISE